MAAQHSLSIVDRSGGHIHRYVPWCVCGWHGVGRRRRREAEGQYRDHIRSNQRQEREQRGRMFAPGLPTPEHRLPEELRRSA